MMARVSWTTFPMKRNGYYDSFCGYQLYLEGVTINIVDTPAMGLHG